jgi:hypothetical protein
MRGVGRTHQIDSVNVVRCRRAASLRRCTWLQSRCMVARPNRHNG